MLFYHSKNLWGFMFTVLVPSPVAMIKYFSKSTSGQTDSFQLTGHVEVYHGWEVTELEAPGHITSAIRREPRMPVCSAGFLHPTHTRSQSQPRMVFSR